MSRANVHLKITGATSGPPATWTPTLDELQRVAAWLAQCVTCGREHKSRITREHSAPFLQQRSFADPDDGHQYDCRSYTTATAIRAAAAEAFLAGEVR